MISEEHAVTWGFMQVKLVEGCAAQNANTASYIILQRSTVQYCSLDDL